MANNLGISMETGLWTLGISSTIGIGFGFLSGLNNRATARHQANILEIKADMEREAAARDLRYYNEKAAREGWASKEERNSVLSTQNLAMAASGFFSQSAGDKRLLKDTFAKYEEAERAANRALYLQSFERTQKAMMAGVELRSQAEQVLIQGKYAPLTGALSGFASGLQTGSQVLSIANTFYADRNTPTEKATKDVLNPDNFNKPLSYSDITGTDPTSDLLKQLGGGNSFEFYKWR